MAVSTFVCNKIPDPNNKLQLHQYLLNKFSSYRTLFNCYHGIFKCINKLKAKIKSKNPDRFQSIRFVNFDDLHQYTTRHIYECDQRNNYAEIFEFFDAPKIAKKDIPPIINQLNLYLDTNNIIRVNSKFGLQKSYARKYNFPILISRTSRLAELLIMDIHTKLSHASRFTVLSELRKQFWIPRSYSLVKTITKNCYGCKRNRNRAIQINQNAYRDFRVEPSPVPFRYVFVDHMGPYYVHNEGTKTAPRKVWVLVICCLWSRAINLEICNDLSANSFLKSLQMHIFKHGLMELCLSDLGSQIVAGSNRIEAYILNDSEVYKFFKYNNIQGPKFEQYFKGRHELGALVEVCVLLTRRLISGSVHNLILSFCDFMFIIMQTIHIVNRRPIAFKEHLTSDDPDFPEMITPEQLIYGRTLISMNIIPEMYHDEPANWDAVNKDVTEAFGKINTARQRLVKIYNDEFIQDLVRQATNQSQRYRPKHHHKLNVGDIVYLKEPMLKPQKYPLAKVLEVFENELGEVTQAILLKGDTREKIKRHVTSLVPMLTNHSEDEEDELDDVLVNEPEVVKEQRPTRKAAIIGSQKTKTQIEQGLV